MHKLIIIDICLWHNPFYFLLSVVFYILLFVFLIYTFFFHFHLGTIDLYIPFYPLIPLGSRWRYLFYDFVNGCILWLCALCFVLCTLFLVRCSKCSKDFIYKKLKYCKKKSVVDCFFFFFIVCLDWNGWKDGFIISLTQSSCSPAFKK